MDAACLALAQVRLQGEIDEIHAVGVAEGNTNGFGNISADHCAHIGHDFGKPWSLTITNEDKLTMHFEIVDSTSTDVTCKRLEEIRDRPKRKRKELLINNR